MANLRQPTSFVRGETPAVRQPTSFTNDSPQYIGEATDTGVAAPTYVGEASDTGVSAPVYAGEASQGTVAPPVDPEQAGMWGEEAVKTGKPTMVSPPGPPQRQQSTRQSVSYQGPTDLTKFNALEKEGDALLGQRSADEIAKMGALSEMQSVAIAEDEKRQLDFQQDYESARQKLAAISEKRDALLDTLSRAEIDPNRYYKSQSAMQQAMLGTSLAMGYIIQARLGMDHNPVMKTLEAAIDRDVRAQEAQLSARLNAAGQINRGIEQSNEAIRTMGIMNATKREHYWDMMSRKLQAEAQRRQIPIEGKNFQILMNEIEKRRLQAKMQADAMSRQYVLNQQEKARKERIQIEQSIAEKMIAAGMAPPNTPAEMAAGILGRANGDVRAVPEGVAPWAPKPASASGHVVPLSVEIDGKPVKIEVPTGLANEVASRFSGYNELKTKANLLIEAQKKGKLDTFNPNYQGLLSSMSIAYGKAKGMGAYDEGTKEATHQIFNRRIGEDASEWAARIKNELDAIKNGVYDYASAASNNPGMSGASVDRMGFETRGKAAGQ